MDPESQARSYRGSEPAALAARAREWVEKRDRGLTAAERQQLREWIAADARHAAAFERADTTRSELDWPLHTDAVDEVLTGLESRARIRRSRRRAATAAGLVVTLVLTTVFVWRFRPPPKPAVESRPSSLIVVAPQTQTLPDGSVVELKDDAEIQVNFSTDLRGVTLIRGAAHFQVVKNPARPFVVKAAGVTAHAVGTAFIVELGAETVSVVVTQGQVAVNQEVATSGIPSAQVTASDPDLLAVLDVGRGVSVPIIATSTARPKIDLLPAVELEQKLAWRIPRLEFSGTPLREVVAMINRHNQVQFVIADPSLDDVKLGGVLRADKIDALVKMLESDFQVKAEWRNDQIILTKSR